MQAPKLLVRAFVQFDRDNAATEAAALAFYTALALAPLLMILIFVSGLIGMDTQEQLVLEINKTMGPQAGQFLELVINNVRREHLARTISATGGVIMLLLSATGVFAQLHGSMNRIWGVHAKEGRGIFSWLRQRVLSLGMVAVGGILMLVSLAASAAANFFFMGGSFLWQCADILISTAVLTAVFAAIFKVLPDVRLTWRDVLPGSAATAVLYVVGKIALSKYLGHGHVGSAYGASGAFLVLLVWVYYSSLIVFFGAELTQVYTHHRGRKIVPLKHATRE